MLNERIEEEIYKEVEHKVKEKAYGKTKKM